MGTMADKHNVTFATLSSMQNEKNDDAGNLVKSSFVKAS